MTRAHWGIALVVLLLVSSETALRLGAASPDTRYTLPTFSLGYFWDTPLGWTGLVDGVVVNKDSVQFASLAGFLRGLAVPVPPEDNVYVRFAGYALLGSAFAPLVGMYASFVLVNVVFWVGGALATFVLAVRHTRSRLVAVLAAVLVSTAPVFAALAGQALPYVASYGLFALSLLLFDQVRLFERGTPLRIATVAGLVGGMSFLFYDLYMLPAFVVLYGLLRRTSLRTLLVVLVGMAVPRLLWGGYWQVMHLPSYSHNETHPIEALYAWFDDARTGRGALEKLKGYTLLAAHGALNIGAAFMFWPFLLAIWELWNRRRSPEAAWFAAVAVAGFAPALFMLSTWPHIPRWYGYGFPMVYILAAAGAVRIARLIPGPSGTPWRHATLAAAVLLPAFALAHLDLLGYTRPMELLLFQPASWAYLWSR
jgi:hypothetical protein